MAVALATPTIAVAEQPYGDSEEERMMRDRDRRSRTMRNARRFVRDNRRNRRRGRERPGSIIFTMAIEVGASATPGADSGYGPGIGRGLAFSLGNGTLNGELLIGHSFASQHELDDLDSANSKGDTTLLMMGGRFNQIGPGTMLSVMAGFARVTIPYLTTSGDSESVAGIGAMLGVGASVWVMPSISIGVDIRAVLARFEIPGEQQLRNPTNNGGVIMGTPSTDDISAFPVFATANVRFWF